MTVRFQVRRRCNNYHTFLLCDINDVQRCLQFVISPVFNDVQLDVSLVPCSTMFNSMSNWMFNWNEYMLYYCVMLSGKACLFRSFAVLVFWSFVCLLFVCFGSFVCLTFVWHIPSVQEFAHHYKEEEMFQFVISLPIVCF